MAATTSRPTGATAPMPFLVRLYPSAWRERYGDEFAELLESRPPKRRDQFDIVASAIDARLHPQIGRAPADEVPTRRDRAVGATLAVGALLLTVWAGLGAAIGPRWESSEVLSATAMSILGVAYVAGILAAFVIAAGLLLIASRYDWSIGPVGAVGAVLTGGGLVFAGLGGGPVALVMLLAGTTMFAWRARGRLIGTVPAVVLVAATSILVGSFVVFGMGGGQDARLMWGLIAFGPAWFFVALDIKAPARVPLPADSVPVRSPTGA